MKMDNENINGNQLLELIRNTKKTFHSKARFPNAILIHPGYYAVLKDVIDTEKISDQKKYSILKYSLQKILHHFR